MALTDYSGLVLLDIFLPAPPILHSHQNKNQRGPSLLGTYFCKINCFSSSCLGALRGLTISWE